VSRVVQEDNQASTIQTRPTLRELALPGLLALRRVWPALLLIQFCGLGMVVAYFTLPPVERACAVLVDLKVRYGYAFSSIANMLAAGLLPEIFKAIALGERTVDRRRLNNIAFNLVFFALTGMVADSFYRLMGYVFGNDGTVLTSMKKMLVDQLVFTPIIGIPQGALAFTWRRNRYSFKKTAQEVGGRWYLFRVVPLLLPCWCYWVPMCMFAYSLPADLQFSFFALATAAWALILVSVASREHATERPIDASVRTTR